MQKILMSFCIIIYTITIRAQIPYGNNPSVGKYLQTKDAKIYYEVYGTGNPLLLIHGSLYGYIDEFETILPDLSQKFKVIAVALRGHGKSEVGNQNYSYELFADDIIQIMNIEKFDTFSILGFSSGAITAIKIAANYPDRIKKVVSLAGALGAIDKRPEAIKKQQEMTGAEFVKKTKEFVDNRKKIMPEPDRFAEFYDKLKIAQLDSVWINDNEVKQIKATVFIIGGDRDEYFSVEAFNRMYSLITNSRLMIVPKSSHAAVLLNKDIYIKYAIPFLEN